MSVTHPMPCPPALCPPDWAEEAMKCWDEMQALRKLITDTMAPDIRALQTAINNQSTQITNIINGTTQITVNSVGIIDGSNAVPGQVGEFISGLASMNYTAYNSTTSQVLSIMTVPPGDWHLWGWMLLTTAVGGANFATENVPPGLPYITALALESSGTEAEAIFLPSNMIRANITAPWPIQATTTVWQTTNSSLPAGVASVFLFGRRMR